MKRLLKLWLMVFLLTSVVYSSVSAQVLFLFKNPIIGKKAPDFVLTSLKGDLVDLEKIRKGKNVILFFWTTWCPHCREAIGEVKARKKEFEHNGVYMILIDGGESMRAVKAYAERRGLDFDILLDHNNFVSDKYNILGIPTFVFIDKEGIVKAVENDIPKDYMTYFKENTKQ